MVKSENLICDRGGQDLSEYLWIFGLKMTVWTMANGWVTICAMKLTFSLPETIKYEIIGKNDFW